MGRIVETAQERSEIDFVADSPPKSNRNVRDWKKIFGLLRKLENEQDTRFENLRVRFEEAIDENKKLQQRVYALELRLRKERLEVLNLSAEDKLFLEEGPIGEYLSQEKQQAISEG